MGYVHDRVWKYIQYRKTNTVAATATVSRINMYLCLENVGHTNSRSSRRVLV